MVESRGRKGHLPVVHGGTVAALIWIGGILLGDDDVPVCSARIDESPMPGLDGGVRKSDDRCSCQF